MALTDEQIATIRAAKILSIAEVADRAGLAESSIRTYRTRNQLPEPDVTIGSTPGWLAETIDPWIATLPGRGARTDIRVADRVLLRVALEIMLRENVTSARNDQLAQGLLDSAPIEAVAQRVVFGAKNLMPRALSAEDAAIVRQANARAQALLRQQT